MNSNSKGHVLMLIESIYVKKSNTKKHILLTIVSVVMGIIFLKSYNIYPLDLYLLFMTAIALLYMVFVILLNKVYQLGNPLLITNKGITIVSVFNIEWKDICAYSFNRYDGISRISYDKKGAGITLTLFKRGGFSKITNLTGHSIFCVYGFFLNNDQINQLINIFNSKAIKRDTLRDDLIVHR
jgi:hypothetical protein